MCMNMEYENSAHEENKKMEKRTDEIMLINIANMLLIGCQYYGLRMISVFSLVDP